MTIEEQSSMPIEENLSIAGFWKRLLALFVDSLLLGLVGLILGLFFADYFSSIGGWGRAVGFAIAWPYLGIMNSRMCGGQTIGKRLLKLRVVSIDGAKLSIDKSLLRAAVFCLPVFLNGAAFSAEILQSWFVYVLTIVVFGFGLSTVYLYIFNRKTRQSLHDLVVGSIVVKTVNSPESVSMVPPWRGHYVVTTLILVASAIGPYFVLKLVDTEPFTGLLPLQKTLASEPGVTSANVGSGSTIFKSTNAAAQTREYLSANVITANKNADFDAMANHLAGIILAEYPASSGKDIISVAIAHGYDIGIASAWRSRNFAFSPSDWRKRIALQPSPTLPSGAVAVESAH
ncbi:MAG: RDD family protein [Pseudomonadota bacterium]